MDRFFRLCFVSFAMPLWVASMALGAQPAAPAASSEEQLARKALVIVRENCQSCHNPEKHKGGLDLTSRQQALKGGDGGVAIVAARAEESALIAALAPDADPHMPPKGQLTADEIHVLRRWIDGGLLWPALEKDPAPTTRPVVLRAMPASYQPVLAIAVAPDGKRLAVGRGDRTMVFDLTANPPARIAEHVSVNEPVFALAWRPDGGLLAVGGYRAVRLWGNASAGPARTFDGLAGRITALAFTPDGGTLIAADGEPGDAGVIRQWRLDEPGPGLSRVGHRDSITSIDVSPDGARVATGGNDRLVKLWDRSAWAELAVLEGHGAPVMAVAFNADATRLASAGADREIRIWDVKTRELLATLTSSAAVVNDVCWVDAKRLLSASDDGLVRLTNQENKERAERTFAGAGDVVYCVALAPDGKTVYAGCHDGKVYAWAVASGKLERTIPAEPPATAPGAAAVNATAAPAAATGN